MVFRGSLFLHLECSSGQTVCVLVCENGCGANVSLGLVQLVVTAAT